MSDMALFTDYFKELHGVARQGDAREESFYPALAAMLKATADATGRTHVRVTTLPKPTDAGNPDFRLWNGADRIVESLAVELAKRTRFLRDVVAQQLQKEQASPGVLHGFYEAFRNYLIGTLSA